MPIISLRHFSLFLFSFICILPLTAALQRGDSGQIKKTINDFSSKISQKKRKRKIEVDEIVNSDDKKLLNKSIFKTEFDSSKKIKDLKLSHKGYGRIIKSLKKLNRKKNKRKLLEVYLNKMTVAYQIGLYYHLHKNNKMLTNKYHGIALDNSKFIIDKDKRKEPLGKAYFTRGLIAYSQNIDSEAYKNFDKTLEYIPKSDIAGWIKTFYGEKAFAKGEFTKALKYYKEALSLVGKQQKQLVLYKITWTYVNLKQTNKAISTLTSLIKKYPDGDFYNDSIRDLALLAARFKSIDQIFALYRKTIKRKKDAIEFLKIANYRLDYDGRTLEKEKILKKLLQLEPDPKNKIGYIYHALGVLQKEYADKNHLRYFKWYWQYVDKYKILSKINSKDSHYDEIFNSTEYAIKSFLNSYTGEIRTTQYNKKQLYTELNFILTKYTKNFPNSKNISNAYTTWFDLNYDQKDYLGLFKNSSYALKLKQVSAKTRALADWNQVVAVDNLHSKNKTKWQKTFLTVLSSYLLRKNPNPKWYNVANKYIDVKFKKGFTLSEIKLLTKIYTYSKKPKDLYSIYWAYYQNKKYTTLIQKGTVAQTKDDYSKKINSIIEESYLKTLLVLQKKKDTKNILNLTQRFIINQNFNKAKKDGTINSLLTYLWNAKQYNSFEKSSIRYKGFSHLNKYQVLVKNYSELLFQKGLFKKVVQYLNQTNNKLNIETYQLSELLINPYSKIIPYLNAVKSNQDKYLYHLSLLTLSQPKLSYQYLMNLNNISTEEKQLFLLSARLHKLQWTFKATAKERSILGDLTPNYISFTPLARLQSVNALKKLNYPSPEDDEQTYNQKLGNSINLIKNIDALVAQELALASPSDQLKLLTTTFNQHKKCQQLILNSPIPKTLTPEQQVQYQTQIKTLAQYHVDTANNYRETVQALKSDDSNNLRASASTNQAELSKPQKWRFPKFYYKAPLNVIAQYAKANNLYTALFVNDRFFNLKKYKLKDQLRIKHGLLLSYKGNNPSIRKFSYQDLKQNYQDKMIKEWRRFQ